MLRKQETSTIMWQTAQRSAMMLFTLVDTDGSVASQITGAQNDSSAITDKAAEKIISDINSFSSGYNRRSFRRYIHSKAVWSAH